MVRIHKELYKKDLKDPDNLNGVITRLTKHPGMQSQVGLRKHHYVSGDGIQAELFQSLKDNAIKVLHSIWQQIWKN